MGQWRLNEDKTDRGLAFAFAPTASGDLQLTEGGRTYLVRFDGKDYPHPLGGVVRWMRLDDRSWETVYALNGRVVGQASYQLSDDGQRLTTRQKIGDRTAVYRRRSGERQGLTGEWSLTSASVTTVAIESADGYDLVFSSGGATCKANFDGRDYPIIEPSGRASTVETCRIARAGARRFSMNVAVNGKPVETDTFTVSDDARTLTHAGGAPGQPPASTLVYDRQ